MRKYYLGLMVVVISVHLRAQPVFQLAPPLLKYESVFFTSSTVASLQFAMSGTTIHYTLDGKVPTDKDPVYRSPLKFSNSITNLQAKVFADGFLPSETMRAAFIKEGLKIKSVAYTAPNERFKGNGPQTLFDNQGGVTGINSKNWLGFQTDSVELEINLQKKQKISEVLINMLHDYNSWVFLPIQIKLFAFDERQNSFVQAAEMNASQTAFIKESSTVYTILKPRKKITAQKLKLVIYPLQSMPATHPGSGKPAWLFVDEIKVY